VRPGAYPSVEHLKDLTGKHYTRLQSFARYKRSSFLCLFVSDEDKEFNDAEPQAAPARAVVEEVEVSDPNPQYNFGYSVADSLTGDSKTREEKRDGDVVTGSYTVADPDGRIRRVTYTAGKF
jgi:hypothetical protein